ncbi:MAG: DUF4288 domain-containing protein [Hormoscilla sp.]
MVWYAAHAIMYVKFKEGEQDKYPVWENVILIKGSSDEEAFERAAKRAKEDEINSDDFKWEDRPASLAYGGIRKLITCSDPEEIPDDGTEITYSQIEVDSEESLFRLIEGEPVGVKYSE